MGLAWSFLGPFQATWDGQPVAFATGPARALLAYLATEFDRAHPRETLAALLWPDHPQDAAYANLRQTLARVRRALPEPAAAAVLRVTPRTLQIERDAAMVDVARFEALLAVSAAHSHPDPAACAACLARLREAVALYRGEFLEGPTLARSQPFEEWLLFRREQFGRQALEALEALGRAAEVAGDHEALRRYAARQVALEPWHEPAHRRLMRALALAGDRTAALAQYARCRQTLADELGVEPDDQTTALAERIRAGDLAPGPPAVRGAVARPGPLPGPPLPIPPTPLLGREDDLARLVALLTDPARRLVTLVGPGGVGKTRLALEGARRATAAYADGARFVDLAPVAAPALVAPALAGALDVREVAGRPLPEVLTAALRDRHLLLLLDNCERVAAAAPLVAELLAACPRLAVLATSRMPLHLRGEQEFAVAPLALPDPARGLTPATQAESPAMALFVARARAVRPDFVLTDENAAVVAEICTRLDGLPLAIELAAARVKLLPPHALLARLDHRLALLTGGAQDLPARQRTLRDTIAWSEELLDAGERRLFRRLGVFNGGGTLEAIAAVAGDDAAIVTLDGVAALVDQCLLRRGEGPDGEPRLQLLETIREYAAERLAEHGEAAAIRRRHAAYYLALAEEAEPWLRGGAQLAWLGRLEVEHANLQAALAWCLAAGEVAGGLRLAGALGAFWRRRGHLGLGYEWLARLLAAGPPTAETTPVRAKALCYAGQLAYHRIDTAAALLALDESVGLYRQLGDAGRRGLAEALTWLGAGRMSADWDLPQARAALDEAVALARAAGDPWTLAGALTRLGLVLLAHGDDAAAGPPLEEGLALWRATGDRWGEGWALFYLGNAAELAGDAPTARACYEASLVAQRAVGDAAGIAGVLGYLGNLAHAAGDEAAARARYEEALATLRPTGNRVGVAYALGRLGGVAAAQGDAPKAARRYRESLALFRELGYGRGLAEWLTSLAGTVRAAGQRRLAARLLGAGAAQLARLGTDFFPADRADFNRTVAATRAALDPAAFAAAWEDGRARPLEGAIAAGVAALEWAGHAGRHCHVKLPTGDREGKSGA